MNKIKFLILTLVLMVVGINLVSAEEYSIKVEYGNGIFLMSLEGFDKEYAFENEIHYFVKFVNDNDKKPELLGSPSDTEEGIGNGINSYYHVNLLKDEENDEYNSAIFIEDDWVMLKGYNKAYIIKCEKQDECEVLDKIIDISKPKLPEIDKRYDILIDKFENQYVISPNFSHFGTLGSHEINVKIGLITDDKLLTKISKNESGSYQELMEYAKNNEGTIFKGKDSEKINFENLEVENGAYYYMYTYYTNEDGLYRDLDGINISKGEKNGLSTEFEWPSEWENFVEYFKKSDNLYIEETKIDSDDVSLTVKATIGEKEYETEYTYADGIITYSKKGHEKYDDMLNYIVLSYICEKFDYNEIQLYKYLYENKDLTLDKNGIEYTVKNLENELSDDKTFTELKVDIVNGLKNYDEALIAYYEFLSPYNQKYVIGEDLNLTFEVEPDLDLFDSVFVDGEKIDESTFTASEGSTIITLKKEYLDKLEVGTHTLKVTFKDGKFAQTNFIIEKAKEEQKQEKPNEEIKNPATGLFLKYSALFLIIIISGIGYLLIRKRSKFPKHN